MFETLGKRYCHSELSLNFSWRGIKRLAANLRNWLIFFLRNLLLYKKTFNGKYNHLHLLEQCFGGKFKTSYNFEFLAKRFAFCGNTLTVKIIYYSCVLISTLQTPILLPLSRDKNSKSTFYCFPMLLGINRW